MAEKSTKLEISSNETDALTHYMDDVKKDESHNEEFKLIPFLKHLAIIASTGFIFVLSNDLANMISLIFIGKIFDNSKMTNGIGIANIYNQCLFVFIIIGMVLAYISVAGYAYSLKKYHTFWLYYYRTIFFCYLYISVMFLLNYFLFKYIAQTFVPDSISINYAFDYNFYLMISNYFTVLMYLNYGYINIIGKQIFSLLNLGVVTVFLPLFNSFFIFYLQLDLEGAGISYMLTRFLVAFGGTMYICLWSPMKEYMFFPNLQILKDLWVYFKFIFPILLQYLTERWFMEFQAIIGNLCLPSQYSAFVYTTNIFWQALGFSISISIAISIYISKYLVVGNYLYLKKAFYTCLAVTLGLNSLIVILLTCLRYQLIGLFSTSKNIIEAGVYLILLYAAILIQCSIWNSFTSLCRALAKNAFALISCGVVMYIINLPLCYVFAITLNFGISGILYSNIICNSVLIILLAVFYLSLDFTRIRLDAIERIENDHFILLASFENIKEDGDKDKNEE